jgi:hypothetical protein
MVQRHISDSLQNPTGIPGVDLIDPASGGIYDVCRADERKRFEVRPHQQLADPRQRPALILISSSHPETAGPTSSASSSRS